MLTLFVVALTGFAQSPPLIRVPVRVVTVPVAVVSARDKFVTGLKVEDFSLFDNGRAQNVRLDYMDGQISLAIAVETNDSVRAWLPEVRRVVSMIEALMVGEAGDASLTSFGDDVKTIQPMTGNAALLDKAFESIKPNGDKQNRILDALAEATKQLEQVSAARRRIILLIAQSGDVGSASSLRDVLRQLELNNITVYSLIMPRIGSELIGKSFSLQGAKQAFHRDDAGFVAGVDLGKLIPEIYRSEKAVSGADEISLITSELGGRIFSFRKPKELENGISLIGEELHTEYLLSYTPVQFEPGYHQIRVQVDRLGTVVRARPGYYAGQP
jgi:VWFA-related protein